MALVKEGYSVHLALPFGDYKGKLEEMGCIIHDTALDRRGKNPLKELALIRCYNKILEEVRPAVVLTYTIKPNIYMGWLCSLKNIPYITTITGLGTAVEGSGPLQLLTGFMYKQALKKVSTVFFQNETNRALFEKRGIAPGRHKLISGSGVNLDRFSLQPYPQGDEVGFLFISRVMKEKGIGEYIEAARVIRKDHPEAAFRVLGFLEDDYEEVEAFNAAIKDGTIIYEGNVSDVRPFIKNAECTIHPSYYPEGMSNVCLESAACGRAVITTDRPGCRDTVRDGISGFVVAQRDVQDLVDAIRRFLAMGRDERKDMGLCGRQYMEDKFDRAIVTDNMVKEIKSLIKG